ncbi:ABC transporter ATP-binding protein [Paenibacillus barengoltzii]|uniref:Energy-coupling factor transport system ATP-binding protein n=2 Tax=Paenibacillus barengoltzii TaxID=343517 RepID=A0ABY1LVK9_9BACL|nr:ABC transporter ATP-binding protein [Paenibacillus barengoltzii]SMF13400.1 energy-coupling factor transport system ATP-binding protein [Paenibacillus barengoltzii J12]
MPQPALELANVSYAFEPGGAPALRDVTLTVERGEWVAIVGASGSGKSALAQMISGYLPRAGGGSRSGRVCVYGVDPAEAAIGEVARRVGVVFQDPDAQLVQGRVEDEVAFGPENLRVPAAELERRVADALAAVALTPRRLEAVHALSGGGRQRTAIAAVLALEPPLLVLDEAAASLDAASRRRLLALLRRLHVEGRTIVTMSGRMDELALAAPRLVVLDAGTVALDGPAERIRRGASARLEALGLLPAGKASAAAAGPGPSGGGPEGHAAASEGGAPQGSPASGARRAAAALVRSPAELALSPAPARAASAEPAPAPTAPTAAAKRGAAPAPATAAPRRTPLLEVRGLSYAFAREAEPVLRDIRLTLYPGEWRLLCGDNGSGKTTLSRLLMGLLRPPKGTVFWQGQDTARRTLYDLASEIGYVFQQPEQQFVASTVLDELLYSPRAELGLRPRDPVPEEVRQRAERMLEAIGLSGKMNESPYYLSGGEKRLLSAASVMICPKKLYILDEPTAGIDYIGVRLLTALCREALDQGAALIMITHEPELFEDQPIQRWRIAEGQIH